LFFSFPPILKNFYYNEISDNNLLCEEEEVANFLLVYYGGKMETDPKKAEKVKADWMKWFTDMGKAVVDAGGPTMPGKYVNNKVIKAGAVGEAVTGYSVLKADNLDAAVALAKSSPQITSGGQIAVYSIMPM
jgi:hypothetical protein